MELKAPCITLMAARHANEFTEPESTWVAPAMQRAADIRKVRLKPPLSIPRANPQTLIGTE